ncbi:MAG: TldD/PmbA family protein, partial [Candidatus Nealsonbacteria bacterium]
MKDKLKNILDWLEPKVSYADLRFVQTEKENIDVENGILSSYNVSTDRGIGIRVLTDGAWGFAASNN